MTIRRHSIAALAVLALAFPATGALAQTAAPTETAPAQPQTEMQQPNQFSDETLRSFAVAFLQVDEINKEYTPRLQSAASEQDKQQIQQEASEKMVEAVEGSEGITVQEYTSIMQAAQANPELAQQLTDYIGQAQQ